MVIIRYCHARNVYWVRYAGFEHTFETRDDAWQWVYEQGLSH